MTTQATFCPDCGSEEVCNCPVEVRCAECNGTHRSHQVSGHPNHPDVDHAPCGWCGGPAEDIARSANERATQFILESAKALLPVFNNFGSKTVKTSLRLGKTGVNARMIMYRNGDVFLYIDSGPYCPSPLSSFMNDLGFSAEYIGNGENPPVFDGWRIKIR